VVDTVLLPSPQQHGTELCGDRPAGLTGERRSREVGMTHINDITPNDGLNMMFGGEKNSGLGRFNSDWIIAVLTSDHWIGAQQEPRAYPF